MHVTDAFKARLQAAKFIFPGEHALNGAKALFKDRRIEAALATALRGFASTRVLGNVGNHAAIENRLAVGPAVVDAVQTRLGPYTTTLGTSTAMTSFLLAKSAAWKHDLT